MQEQRAILHTLSSASTQLLTYILMQARRHGSSNKTLFGDTMCATVLSRTLDRHSLEWQDTQIKNSLIAKYLLQ